MAGLTEAERAAWHDDGFFIRRGAVDLDVCEAMLDRVVEISRTRAEYDMEGVGLVLPEPNLRAAGNRDHLQPEQSVSKIFRLHRDPVFADGCRLPVILEAVPALLGPAAENGVDCFLSQFIFKNPGAYGQPWHQDSYYFKFDTPGAVHQVGAWIAVTEATLGNGCLWVLPGSHHQPVHEHVPDARPDTQMGYVEIVDHDMSGEVPVLMQPGDLLLFDSHLMHRSTDNESDGLRAAMVYHYSPTGTVDTSGSPYSVTDFVSVLEPVG